MCPLTWHETDAAKMILLALLHTFKVEGWLSYGVAIPFSSVSSSQIKVFASLHDTRFVNKLNHVLLSQ